MFNFIFVCKFKRNKISTINNVLIVLSFMFEYKLYQLIYFKTLKQSAKGMKINSLYASIHYQRVNHDHFFMYIFVFIFTRYACTKQWFSQKNIKLNVPEYQQFIKSTQYIYIYFVQQNYSINVEKKWLSSINFNVQRTRMVYKYQYTIIERRYF